MEGRNARELAERLEKLIEEVESTPNPELRSKSQALVTALMDLYGSGLSRVLEIVHQSVADPDPVFDRLAGDELVSSLLVLHGLHPETLERRIERALVGVRPFLKSHGADVVVAALDETDVHLRFVGSPPAKMKLVVEEAVRKAAPEVENIHGASGSDFVQIGALRALAHSGSPT